MEPDGGDHEKESAESIARTPVDDAWKMTSLDFWGPLISIGFALLISRAFPLPVPVQMVAITFPTIYFGANLSLDNHSNDDSTSESDYFSDLLRGDPEFLTKSDALTVPLVGSAALFSLYVAYWLLPRWIVNATLSALLATLGALAMTNTCLMIFERCNSSERGFACSASRLQRVFAVIISMIITVTWWASLDVTLHNLIAVNLSMHALSRVFLPSFSVAAWILGGLCVYDAAWVFGSDVMVAVASQISAPAKLLFPRPHAYTKPAILGLGDVILPGLFVALARRYGGKVYLITVLAAYEVALIMTNLIAAFSKHPQPALIYLVPTVLAAFWSLAAIRQEIADARRYDEYALKLKED